MAGKELYIQPILAESLDGVQQIAEKMVEIETQFTQSIRIQSNILANTGIAQTQKAYSGAEFSALALATGTASSTFTPGAMTAIDRNSASFYKTQSTEEFTIKAFDLTTISNITFDAENVRNGQIAKAYAGTKSVNISAGTNSYSLDVSELTGNIEVKFGFAGFGNQSPTSGTIKNIRFDGIDVDYFTFIPNLVFSNNILKLSSTLVDNNNFSQAYGKVTIPNITGANMWNSCIINGKLDGVNMSIVDNTSGDKLLDLAGSLTDISILPQLSNLAVKFEFGEGSENSYISSVIFRYY